MTDASRAAHLLRERALSYARDAETLDHIGNADPRDMAILRTMVIEIRRVADEVEVFGSHCACQWCSGETTSTGECGCNFCDHERMNEAISA